MKVKVILIALIIYLIPLFVYAETGIYTFAGETQYASYIYDNYVYDSNGDLIKSSWSIYNDKCYLTDENGYIIQTEELSTDLPIKYTNKLTINLIGDKANTSLYLTNSIHKYEIELNNSNNYSVTIDAERTSYMYSLYSKYCDLILDTDDITVYSNKETTIILFVI